MKKFELRLCVFHLNKTKTVLTKKHKPTMPIYNKEFGCWMSDPFPDASLEYDTDSKI